MAINFRGGPARGVCFKRWPRWCRWLRVEHLRYGTFDLYDALPEWAESLLRAYFYFVLFVIGMGIVNWSLALFFVWSIRG